MVKKIYSTTAYFFMNSSEKFYSKITNNRFYGNSVKVYIEQNKIPLKAKIIILISIFALPFFNIDDNIRLEISNLAEKATSSDPVSEDELYTDVLCEDKYE